MEERLKQRLVGAVVLVSLAVVFVPILFDMPGEPNGETSADLISGIPERPQVEFGSSASGTLDAPQTPRLDTELERESSRNASRAGAGERIVSSEVLVSGTTSSAPGTPAPARTGERTVSSEVPVAGTTSISSGASGSAQVADASEPPVSQARSETSVARADPAPAKKQAKQGSSTKPVAAVSAGGGWTVQLGSFLKSENAAALRKRLQARWIHRVRRIRNLGAGCRLARLRRTHAGPRAGEGLRGEAAARDGARGDRGAVSRRLTGARSRARRLARHGRKDTS